MREKINEWASAFDREVQIKETDRWTIVYIHTNVVYLSEVKTLEYMTGKEVGLIEAPADSELMSIYLLK